MFLASDNTGPAHPSVLQALIDANQGHVAAYGEEAAMAELRTRIRDLFEAPDAAVHLTPTGTAANAILLACLSRPWQAIFCADLSHVHRDECGAPEFFTDGTKLIPVPTTHGKMAPDTLRDVISGEGNRGVFGVQRGPVSITQLTECGTLYGADEIGALCDVARDFGLPVHLDGARFANALTAANCSPADLTWRAGVDAVTFGGTKNGLLAVETAILFNPDKAWEFELRRKRSGHLFSKNRYLTAQMHAYLTDDLWLELARRANRNASHLAKGLAGIDQVAIHHPVDGNMIFASWTNTGHRALCAAGAQYGVAADDVKGSDDARLSARLVCDWSIETAQIDRFLNVLRGAYGS